MKLILLPFTLTISLLLQDVKGMVASTTSSKQRTGGKGMGMGMASTKNIKNSKKNNKSPPFDANAALMRQEKLHDELVSQYSIEKMYDDDEDDDKNVPVLYDYVIAARAVSGQKNKKKSALSDWLPIASMCLVLNPQFETTKPVQNSISAHCRELYAAAVFSVPAIASIPRNSIEYGYEPLDSWEKYVYKDVIEGTNQNDMTKSEAREILGLHNGKASDRASIKKAWRDLNFILHPDRLVGKDQSEKDEAEIQLERVNTAFEVLSSGIRSSSSSAQESSSSWYTSLGGKQRTDFTGPISLIPLEEAEKGLSEPLTIGGFKTAFVGIDPDIVLCFAARNRSS